MLVQCFIYMNNSQVALVKCGNYDAVVVEAAVKRAVDLLGGIEVFVKPGERVLIKPNLLTDAKPEEGITTHPEVVRALIRLVKQQTDRVFVGDGPSVWGEKQDLDRVFEATGIKQVCREEGATIAYFTTPKMAGRYPLTDWLDKVDRVINVPKFKTHGLTILTAGAKNLFGLIVGMNKMKVHRDFPHPDDLSRAIIDLYEIRRPDLTICDGIIAMEGEGPGSSGTLRPMGLIATSPDALALDCVLAFIMGVEPVSIPTIKEAHRRGLVPGGISKPVIVGDPLNAFAAKNFILPKGSILCKLPRWSLFIVKIVLRMKPAIVPERCVPCGVCGQACPAHAISQKAGRAAIDYKKCILCLCCQEICPHQAVVIKKNIFLRMLSRQ